MNEAFLCFVMEVFGRSTCPWQTNAASGTSCDWVEGEVAMMRAGQETNCEHRRFGCLQMSYHAQVMDQETSRNL